MKRTAFIEHCLPLATKAGQRYKLHPLVILAQAALESGWGKSRLATACHNYFGITGYGKPNAHWDGCRTDFATASQPGSLHFRIYRTDEESFLDFGRLISNTYPMAAAMSAHPEAYAKEIAYSRYITETNGDDREAYRHSLSSLCRTISKLIRENGMPPLPDRHTAAACCSYEQTNHL